MKRVVIALQILAFGLLAHAADTPVKLSKSEKKAGLKRYCKRFNKEIKRYYWGHIICNPKTWRWDEEFTSPKGKWPLVYQVFDSNDDKIKKSTTLVQCGIHGDELPTVYMCIHMVRDILFDNKNAYKGHRVVIAPLVNPDGFFRKYPTRQNGRGVDLNRNFPTRDFNSHAIRDWKRKYRSSPRKYPGKKGASEIETQFQIMLMDKYRPDKIISIHSPYGWLDFDSPGRHKIGDEPDGYDFRIFKKESKGVAKTMSKKSNNYPLTSFRIYPGSLGNYAATERGIPVYTLELPTSGAEKAHKYWRRMRKGIMAAVRYELHTKPKEMTDEKKLALSKKTEMTKKKKSN